MIFILKYLPFTLFKLKEEENPSEQGYLNIVLHSSNNTHTIIAPPPLVLILSIISMTLECTPSCTVTWGLTSLVGVCIVQYQFC